MSAMGRRWSTSDIVGPAIAAEDMFQATCLTPATGATIRGLAELAPVAWR